MTFSRLQGRLPRGWTNPRRRRPHGRVVFQRIRRWNAGGVQSACKERRRADAFPMGFFSRVRYGGMNAASASWSSATKNVADAIETGGITR
jgi:hypothetical protein